MAKKRYCRFYTTRLAIEDCLDALSNEKYLSVDEATAGRWMFDEFLDFCRENYIITDYDASEIESLFDSLTEKEDKDDDH